MLNQIIYDNLPKFLIPTYVVIGLIFDYVFIFPINLLFLIIIVCFLAPILITRILSGKTDKKARKLAIKLSLVSFFGWLTSLPLIFTFLAFISIDFLNMMDKELKSVGVPVGIILLCKPVLDAVLLLMIYLFFRIFKWPLKTWTKLLLISLILNTIFLLAFLAFDVLFLRP